ncbi:MAG: glutamyl-tRNA reductase, partial [Actinomycetota bacterium]
MAIIICGLSHKTVPLPVLEQVAFPTSELGKSLARLLDHEPIHEGVILSTCNRTEIYATVHRFHPAIEAVHRFLSDVSG